MSKQRNAFTLIELVVVILILGILAGVGAPKLFSTSGKATESGVKQTLSVVRNAIELYAADHSGAFPPCTGDGTGAGNFHEVMVDYLRGKFPTSPVGDNNLITPSTDNPLAADAAPTTGWKYNPTTGEFICNSGDNAPSGAAFDEL